MSFQFSFRVDPEAITVPYAPITDGIRRNRGFVDLRGHPEKAEDIAEGNESPALWRLLIRIAYVGSTIVTLGCDLGSHQEPIQVPLRRREAAGGYIQIASVHHDHAEREAYAAFANAIVANVKSCARKDHWELNFVGQMVNFQLDPGRKGIHPSLMIWVFAAARDQVTALQSRERLIEAIDEGTALPGTLKSFGSDARASKRRVHQRGRRP
jgi:hypothetical protein